MIVFKEKLEHFWKNKIVILGINSNFKDNFCIYPKIYYLERQEESP